ncbi:YfhE family protein [Rummeliibacillus sp. JY-2-4R]
MKDQKLPPQHFTTKYNGLTSMQEILYRKDFQRADAANEKDKRTKK